MAKIKGIKTLKMKKYRQEIIEYQREK